MWWYVWAANGKEEARFRKREQGKKDQHSSFAVRRRHTMYTISGDYRLPEEIESFGLFSLLISQQSLATSVILYPP